MYIEPGVVSVRNIEKWPVALNQTVLVFGAFCYSVLCKICNLYRCAKLRSPEKNLKWEKTFCDLISGCISSHKHTHTQCWVKQNERLSRSMWNG